MINTTNQHNYYTPLTSYKAKNLKGKNVIVAGDKSISHRSLLIASQTLGHTCISGLLEGEDVLATATALQSLGVSITRRSNGDWHVTGVGIGGLQEPDNVLDMGNAGTGARLMMGLLSSYNFVCMFTGDKSLCSRPMQRVITPLSEIGASFIAKDGDKMPLAMQGAATPLPLTYRLPVASAQVKSAILLAGLNVSGKTTVIEPEATRDHTEKMLNYFGIEVTENINDDGEKEISIIGQQPIKLEDRTITVPADPSSAAFLIVAALLTKGSKITIDNVCINQSRIGVITSLQEMGGDIKFKNIRISAGEDVADISVKYSKLKCVDIPASRAASMIDEYPILAVACAYAKGDSVLRGLSELKVKESDRLQAIIDGLYACGVSTKLDDADNLTIFGTNGDIQGGCKITTNFDHRIAMSFLVMGMVTNKPVMIDDANSIATSFPNFVELINSLGGDICEVKHNAIYNSQVSISTNNHKLANSKTKKSTKKPIASQPSTRPKVIAIDGPAASGKGTIARRLAAYYGSRHLDTGTLYRAVALKMIYDNKNENDKIAAINAAKSISSNDLSNPHLRQEKVARLASIVSALPEVRDILLEFQQNFSKNKNGAVLDGRDIGTVVCPKADIKIFITAGVEARAGRRHRELQGQGIKVIYDSVLKDLKERDARDKKRKNAPLKASVDAFEIDTTTLKIDEVFDKIITHIEIG